MKIILFIISRILLILLLFLISGISVNAQSKQRFCDWKCYTSVGINVTGIIVDTKYSRNQYERTAIFRNDEGKFDTTKYVLFQSGVLASTLLFDKLVENKPKLRWMSFSFRITLGTRLIIAGVNH